MNNHFSDTAFWFFLILGGFVIWVSAGVFYTWNAHRKITELERKMKIKDDQYADLIKRVEDLEKSHPFAFMRRAN